MGARLPIVNLELELLGDLAVLLLRGIWRGLYLTTRWNVCLGCSQ